jgi:hypothetical protein
VSSVPRHSEEELRQQWAFLDALVDRQASSLKSGVQDPEEVDLVAPADAAGTLQQEEIANLTRRVTTLEGERQALLRRIDLSEEARMAAETARAEAEDALLAAQQALAAERLGAERALEPEAVLSAPVAVAPAAPADPAPAAPWAATPAPAPALFEAPAPKPAPAAVEAPPTAPARHEPVRGADGPPAPLAGQPGRTRPKGSASKSRLKTWWQRLRG